MKNYHGENSILQGMNTIDRLRRHGAEIYYDGVYQEVNSFIWDTIKDNCIRMGANAISYNLRLPDVDEILSIACWADGHVDVGSEDAVLACMNQF